MKRYGWTYSRETSGPVIVRRHKTMNAAKSHYEKMRVVGGPRLIGMIGAEFDPKSARAHITARFGALNVQFIA